MKNNKTSVAMRFTKNDIFTRKNIDMICHKVYELLMSILIIYMIIYDTAEFKIHVSGNGKRQVRTFLAKFSLNVFV